MLDQDSIQAILGIKEKVYLTPDEMADHMNVTFFPYEKNASPEVLYFKDKLHKTFKELKVNIVPYKEALTKISYSKVLKNVVKMLLNNILYGIRFVLGLSQKNHYFSFNAILYLFNNIKVKKGISIIVMGEQDSSDLPMKYIFNFKDNSVITILDFPKNISETSTFHQHFDTALSLFSRHMTNIVIGVDKQKWLLYNFNASHPIFPLEKDFKENVLHALVPKIVAPIRPYTLSEFVISKDHFDINSNKYKHQIEDLVDGALVFSKTDLYPKGKKIDELPFVNDFYRWIGKLHLDNRNGMSYGFLAEQLPGDVSPLIKESDFADMLDKPLPQQSNTFHNDELYIKLNLNNENFWLKVPEVWVLSQKSGSDKTHVNPNTDLIMMGLSNGKMMLETQHNSVLDNDYKTSFDTQVILAHSVGNAIVASVLNHINPKSEFLKNYKNNGISIAHWHGYIHPEHVPLGWHVHGVANPHVACSSPQSAIYALQGKMQTFFESLKNSKEYKGDIHIEPHHGTNICFTSVSDLANYLVKDPSASVLGNSYYYLYNGSKV